LVGLKLSIITADVLGTKITPTAEAYAQLLRQVASAIEQCMGGPND